MASTRNVRRDDLGGGSEESDIKLIDRHGGSDGDDSGTHRNTPGTSVPPVASNGNQLDIPSVDPALPNAEDIAKRALSTTVRNWGHPDDPLWQTHTRLADFLFKKSWNGINPRECCVLTITVTPIGVQATLKMPSEAQSLTSVSSHVGDLLNQLEYDMAHGTGMWKELKNGPGAQKLREDRKKMVEIEKQKK